MELHPTRDSPWDSDAVHREIPVPQLVGYDVVRMLGHGSMGYVYECHSAEHGPVAVKVLNFGGEGSSMAVERFRREVSVGERIGHPGIPRVFDSGRLADGRYFLTMELLKGCDLEAWWDAAGHTRAEALDLICKALEPLAAAHDHGVVHRDMKPENVFVERNGGVRLLDFGVARSPDSSENVRTATGIAVGTPVYMSPEQATRPAFVDARSDVWSAGVMMYEAVCGELPFTGDSPHAVVLQACTAEPISLAERVPEVHAQIHDLVHRCLRKDPRLRPANGAALSTELKALLARDDVRASLAGPAAAPSFRLSATPKPMSFGPAFMEGVATEANLAVAQVALKRRTGIPRAFVWPAALVLVAAALVVWSMARRSPPDAVATIPQSTGAVGVETPPSESAPSASGAPPGGNSLGPAEHVAPGGLDSAADGDRISREAPRPVSTGRDTGRGLQVPGVRSGAETATLPTAGTGESQATPSSGGPPAAEPTTPAITAERGGVVQGSDASAATPPSTSTGSQGVSSMVDTPQAAPNSTPPTASSMSTVSPPRRPTTRPRPTQMRPERPDFVTF